MKIRRVGTLDCPRHGKRLSLIFVQTAFPHSYEVKCEPFVLNAQRREPDCSECGQPLVFRQL